MALDERPLRAEALELPRRVHRLGSLLGHNRAVWSFQVPALSRAASDGSAILPGKTLGEVLRAGSQAW